MNYIQNNLSANETVVYEASIHWFVFVKPILILLAGVILSTATYPIFYYGGLGLLAIGAIVLLKRLLQKISNVYAVTNKKAILKTGITDVIHLSSYSVNAKAYG